jgi:apolipoprotein N-acyltransferase
MGNFNLNNNTYCNIIINSSLLGVIIANIVNTSLYTVIFILYSLLKRKLGVNAGIIFLITFWISFEKFHLNWQFSWPWLNLGNVFSERIDWIQWYEYTGVFGGTLWVLLSNCFLFKLIRQYDSSPCPSAIRSVKYYSTALWGTLILIITPIVISLLIQVYLVLLLLIL